MSDGTAIYIHVPFCVRKCHYCDFYSETEKTLIPGYVQALLTEIKTRPDREQACRVKTVYLGGGTPSVLPVRDIEKILCALNQTFRLLPDAEITMEVNPGTVDAARLNSLKSLGITRLSIGVQSFHPRKLRFLGRMHTAAQAVKAIRAAEKSGFDNIGIDLMYGLPFDSRRLVADDIETAADMGLPHLSCYMLTLEPGTRLHRDLVQGKFTPMPGRDVSGLFGFTSEFLVSRGYEHYEISNFSRGPGMRSRHNSHYWQRKPYLGFGPAAHSFDGRVRYWNHSSLSRYTRAVQSGVRPVGGRETLTRRQAMLEAVMLGLRTLEGISLDRFSGQFGGEFKEKFAPVLARVTAAGLGVIENRHFRLTPRGRIRLDSIVEAFAEIIHRRAGG